MQDGCNLVLENFSGEGKTLLIFLNDSKVLESR